MPEAYCWIMETVFFFMFFCCWTVTLLSMLGVTCFDGAIELNVSFFFNPILQKKFLEQLITTASHPNLVLRKIFWAMIKRASPIFCHWIIRMDFKFFFCFTRTTFWFDWCDRRYKVVFWACVMFTFIIVILVAIPFRFGLPWRRTQGSKIETRNYQSMWMCSTCYHFSVETNSLSRCEIKSAFHSINCLFIDLLNSTIVPSTFIFYVTC